MKNFTYFDDLIEEKTSNSFVNISVLNCSKRCMASRTNARTSAAACSLLSDKNSSSCKRNGQI